MICTINFNNISINFKITLSSHCDVLVAVTQKFDFGREAYMMGLYFGYLKRVST
jgi:hypothetical protein